MNRLKDLGSIIGELYRQLGLEGEYFLGYLKEKWPFIVGETIAANSEPQSIKDGELLVKVNSPVWSEELKFSTHTLLERLRPFHIKRIRFRVGKIKPRTVNNAPTISNKETLTVICATNPEAFGSEGVREFIDAATSSIQDKDLRDSIKRAMEKAFIRRKNIHDPRRNPF
jgi:hypothetical protein